MFVHADRNHLVEMRLARNFAIIPPADFDPLVQSHARHLSRMQMLDQFSVILGQACRACLCRNLCKIIFSERTLRGLMMSGRSRRSTGGRATERYGTAGWDAAGPWRAVD